VFHTHRKALGTGLATALIVAVTAAPAALAQPLDLRSPDARDAANGRQIIATGPPTWPASPHPITTPRVVVSAQSSGLDWGSAGVGAAAVIGAVAIASAGILGLRRRRIARPAR
jgi:hypothetical protein